MSAGNKAIVIGAGLGGLAIALRLSARGWQVTVLEHGPSPGGKMNRWESQGFRFDTGPSLITMPWVFEDLFATAGAKLPDHVQLTLVEPLADYAFADGMRFQVSASLPQWLATLRKLEPRGDERFLRFMALGAKLFALSQRTFFRRSPADPPDWASLKALRYMPLRRAWGSYQRTVRAFFQTAHLRQMYERFPTYVGSSPRSVPATLTVIPYLEHAFGGWHVGGGLYEIVLSLSRLLESRGVTIATGQTVVRIATQAGRACGVETADGRLHPADVVIMNGDPSDLPRLLGQANAPGLPEADRSLSGFVMLLGLRRRLDGIAHHTVCFSADYAREFDDLFVRRRFPDDPTVYVSAPSRTDPTMAPAGCEALFVMANAPANDADTWDEPATAEARRRVFARLRQSGFPDIQSDIAVSTIWTPRKMADAYLMPGGAIYGTHSHGWRKAFLRPPNKHRRVGGLYCVGGGTHPGGGTPTVLLSAKIVSDMIARHEGR